MGMQVCCLTFLEEQCSVSIEEKRTHGLEVKRNWCFKHYFHTLNLEAQCIILILVVDIRVN